MEGGIETLIESPNNPRIKEILHLKKHRNREEQKRFIIEGYRELLRASSVQFPIESVFYCPPLFLKDNEPRLLEMFHKRNIPLYELSERAFNKISYRDRPDGLFAIGQMQEHAFAKFQPVSDGLYLAMEKIEKPGNLGSMLRTCDAAGIHGVFILDPQTDIYNPNVVRSSVGTLFSLPLYVGTSSEAIALFQKHDIKIAAALCNGSKRYTACSLKGPTVIVMGCEQSGLEPQWNQHADLALSIPMHGISDSLNVSTAASILIYEAVRQRSLP